MYKKLVKRVLDFVLALVLFILSFPVVFIAGVLILCIDKMKPIFKQRRVGKNQKIFKIYKLQTMKKDKDGVNKVTKLGKFLRATSIDELPQLVNILKGEMALLGLVHGLKVILSILLKDKKEDMRFYQVFQVGHK